MAACTTTGSLAVPSTANTHLAGLEAPGSFSQLVDRGHGGPTALEELVSHLSLRENADWSHGTLAAQVVAYKLRAAGEIVTDETCRQLLHFVAFCSFKFFTQANKSAFNSRDCTLEAGAPGQ